jgi:hypothetical protein
MVSTAPHEPTPPPPTPDELNARASGLADDLGETDPAVRKLLRRLVQRLGWPLCEQVLEGTREIEEGGGLWSVVEKSRRTKGGVFFALLKGSSAAARRIIYLHQARKDNETRKSAPPFTWEERVEIVREALQHRGTAMTAKLLLMGRPEKVVERGDFVVTSLEYRGAPSLPKGVPSPKSTRTVYTVYIAAKQWRKVADLLKNPEDQLIVEGYCTLDPEMGNIALLAQSATTKVLQRQKLDKAPKGAASKAAAPAPAPTPAPAAPPLPDQAAAAEEEQLRAQLTQRLAGGQTLEAIAARAGLPLRPLQDFRDARPTTLTKAQVQTLMQKLRLALR